jgi:hypothetical protein
MDWWMMYGPEYKLTHKIIDDHLKSLNHHNYGGNEALYLGHSSDVWKSE